MCCNELLSFIFLFLLLPNNDLSFNSILNLEEKYFSTDDPPVLGICINYTFISLFLK